jgi:hypothetical protein
VSAATIAQTANASQTFQSVANSRHVRLGASLMSFLHQDAATVGAALLVVDRSSLARDGSSRAEFRMNASSDAT